MMKIKAFGHQVTLHWWAHWGVFMIIGLVFSGLGFSTRDPIYAAIAVLMYIISITFPVVSMIKSRQEPHA